MKKAIVWCLVLALLLSGCAGKQKPAETTPPEPIVLPSPTEQETLPEAEETTEAITIPTEPEIYRNPLNGKMIDEPFTGRIFANTVSNMAENMPHVGVNHADVVMEMYVNMINIVRCLALFTDIDSVDAIGSTRSTRPIFNDVAQHYDLVLTHAGGSDEALADADNRGLDHFNLDSWELSDTGAAYRDKVYKRSLEAERAAQFREIVASLEVSKAELTTEYSQLEYNVRKSIGCSAACTFLVDEPLAPVYDILYAKMKNPAGDGSVRAQTGMIAISPSHLPGDEGNITTAQFFEMLDAGWTYAIRYRGEEVDGPFADYLAEAEEVLAARGISGTTSVYFDFYQYTSDYDDILAARGYKYAMHHGEEQIMCIESEYEGDILHPGATGWNTIGLNSGLLSELSYTGGYTVLYLGFETGYDSYFAPDLSKAIESFWRMIDAFGNFEEEEFILFFADPDEAIAHRESFMKTYEERRPEIDTRLSEILAELDAIELRIIQAHADFFKK